MSDFTTEDRDNAIKYAKKVEESLARAVGIEDGSLVKALLEFDQIPHHLKRAVFDKHSSADSLPSYRINEEAVLPYRWLYRIALGLREAAQELRVALWRKDSLPEDGVRLLSGKFAWRELRDIAQRLRHFSLYDWEGDDCKAIVVKLVAKLREAVAILKGMKTLPFLFRSGHEVRRLLDESEGLFRDLLRCLSERFPYEVVTSRYVELDIEIGRFLRFSQPEMTEAWLKFLVGLYLAGHEDEAERFVRAHRPGLHRLRRLAQELIEKIEALPTVPAGG